MHRRIVASFIALAAVVPVTVAAQAAGNVRAEIEQVDHAWQTAYNAGNATAVAALYADDAKLMAPGSEPFSGRAAIAGYFKQAVAQGAQMALTTREVLGRGDYVTATGGYVATAKDGSHLDHGTYMTVYKRVKGAWMIYRDTWATSMAH